VASCGFGDLKGLASFWLPTVPELWVFCDSSFLLRDRGFIAQQCPWGAAASLSGWFLFLLHGACKGLRPSLNNSLLYLGWVGVL